jgi:hypothetical protein
MPGEDKAKEGACTVTAAPTTDRDIVDWKPNDPENQYNWPSYNKWRHVAYVSRTTVLM